MVKKKFGQTIVGKALKGILGTIVPGIQPLLNGENLTVDGIITAIKGDPGITADQKLMLEQQILDAVAREEEAVSKRWASDAMSDSWLSKNIRPGSYVIYTLLIVFLMISDFYSVDLNVSPEWITFIMTTYGAMTFAYFGGRTWEKVHKIKR